MGLFIVSILILYQILCFEKIIDILEGIRDKENNNDTT